MVSILKKFQDMLGNSPEKEAAQKLYIASVTQARNPFFYLDAGVPDTLDGRFDLIVLHLFALQTRLISQEKSEVNSPLCRILVEVFIDDMDRNLREMGVGDVGVGKRVRKMSEALYGRFAAYDDALAAKRTWQDALDKNVYGSAAPSVEKIHVLENYIKKLLVHLEAAAVSELREGKLSFDGILKKEHY